MARAFAKPERIDELNRGLPVKAGEDNALIPDRFACIDDGFIFTEANCTDTIEVATHLDLQHRRMAR